MKLKTGVFASGLQWLRRHARTLSFLFIVFALSRLLVGSALLLSEPPLERQTKGYWRVDHGLESFARWDSGWYLKVATEGYQFTGDYARQQDVVFFPLYPLLIRGGSALLGWHVITSGVVISHLAFGAALCFFYAFVRRHASSHFAGLSVLFMAFGPYSVFFSTVYSEALFVCLFSAFLYLWSRQKFLLAGIVAGFASATRLQGILFALPFAFRGLWMLGYKRRLPTWDLIAGGLLSVAGAVTFMTYLNNLTGDWLLIPKLQQQAWNHLPFSLSNVQATLGRELNESLDAFSRPGAVAEWLTSAPRLLDVWALMLATLLTLYLVFKTWREPWVWLAPAMLAVNVYAISGAFYSMGRYLTAVPLYYFALAVVLGRLPRWLSGVVLALSAVVMVQFAQLFGAWYWAG